METNAVELLVKKQVESNADIVTGQAIQHLHNGYTLMERPQYDDSDAFLMDMLIPTLHHTIWGRLIRRKIYTENDIHAKEGVNIGEDYQVMAILAMHRPKTTSILDIIYHYDNTNESSYMNASQKDVYSMMKRLTTDAASTEYVFTFCQHLAPEHLDIVKKALKELYFILLKLYSKVGDSKGYNQIKNKIRLYQIPLTNGQKYKFGSYHLRRLLKLDTIKDRVQSLQQSV